MAASAATPSFLARPRATPIAKISGSAAKIGAPEPWRICRKTIAVIASEDLRSSRAGARGHEALAERSARQMSQQEKAHRATYVVVNDGTVEELDSKLSELLEMLGS